MLEAWNLFFFLIIQVFIVKKPTLRSYSALKLLKSVRTFKRLQKFEVLKDYRNLKLDWKHFISDFRIRARMLLLKVIYLNVKLTRDGLVKVNNNF